MSLWTLSRGLRGPGDGQADLGRTYQAHAACPGGGPGSLLAKSSKSSCEETSSKKQRALARFLHFYLPPGEAVPWAEGHNLPCPDVQARDLGEGLVPPRSVTSGGYAAFPLGPLGPEG